MTGKNNGGPSASAPLVRAVEMCQDGLWHDYEEVVYEVCKAIPPGKAMRRAETNRLSSGGPPERYQNRNPQRVLDSGKRSIARDFIRFPWFEIVPTGRHPRGTPRKVRLVKLPARIDLHQPAPGAMTWARTG